MLEGQQGLGMAAGKGVRFILEYLMQHAGDDWQQRWDASQLGRGEIRVRDLDTDATTAPTVGPGLRSLFCLRVIQPSLQAFRANVLTDYASYFVAAQQDPLLDKYTEQAAAAVDVPPVHRREALFEVCCLLTVQGIALADLKPAALLHQAHETRRVRAILHPGNAAYANKFAGLSAWNVLHRMGHFPPDTPATMRAAMHRGQLTVEQMVDRYPIENRAVRQLLLDYFQRRAADTDYASLVQLVLLVAKHFWAKIEQINPGQADLRISPEVYARWRDLIRTRDDGKPRAGQDSIVIAVRSFYYDLHTWAADEPEQWGAVGCALPGATR